MTAMPPIKGVLFDMDDTLIDWSGFANNWHELENFHLRQVYDYLHETGRPLETDFEQFFTTYRNGVVEGWSEARTTLRAPHQAVIMRQTLETFGCIFDEVVTIEGCLQAYGWRGGTGVTVFPDVPEALQKLREMDIRIGILTNSSQPMWMRLAELERFDLIQYFPDVEMLMSAADLGYLKPHPNVFQEALKRMGTTAEETIYVGDNPVADIAGSQGAGMRAVLRINHPAPPLISGLIVPDAAINTLYELVPLIEDWVTYANPGPY